MIYVKTCVYIFLIVVFRGMLVSACEERSVLIFDASNQQFIKKLDDAHQRCVNCVK